MSLRQRSFLFLAAISAAMALCAFAQTMAPAAGAERAPSIPGCPENRFDFFAGNNNAFVPTADKSDF